jgi:hypothetical protein
MISCGSAFTMTSVTLTRYIRSITGMIQLNPGIARCLYFPRRSTNPLLVGRTTLTPAKKINSVRPTPI